MLLLSNARGVLALILIAPVRVQPTDKPMARPKSNHNPGSRRQAPTCEPGIFLPLVISRMYRAELEIKQFSDAKRQKR